VAGRESAVARLGEGIRQIGNDERTIAMALERIDPARPVLLRELLLVAVVAYLFLLLTLLPYVAVDRATPRGQQYMWWLWGPDEGNAYLAWMRQAEDGAWLLGNKFTPPHPGSKALFCNAILVGGGKLAGALDVPLIAVYHGLRIVAGVFCLTAFYALVGLAFHERHVRQVALALAMFSAGLGWAAELLLGPEAAATLGSVDFSSRGQIMPEAITFHSLLLNPLFAAGAGLICLCLALGLLALRRRSLWYAAGCGLALLVLGNVHTYDIFVVFGTLLVLVIAALVGRQVSARWAALAALLILLLSAPGWGWMAYTIHADPEYATKAATKTLSPEPLGYLCGYGLLVVFAGLGMGHLYRWRGFRPREAYVFLVWLLVNIPLLYAPVSFQRKMAEGLHLAICGLAGLGVSVVLGPLLAVTAEHPHFRRALRAARLRFVALAATCVLVTTPSCILFVIEGYSNARSNMAHLPLMPPVYLGELEVQALDWLDGQAGPDDVVLCTNLIGSYVPSWTSAHVVSGHWAETLNFRESLSVVANFYAPGQDPRVRSAILSGTRTTWVYLGPYERWMGSDWLGGTGEGVLGAPEVTTEELEELPELTLRFRNGDAALFEVDMPPSESAPGSEVGEGGHPPR
jgi:hypothetical protein